MKERRLKLENFISSKTNKNIKYAKKLLLMPKFRKQERKFITEGARLCEEALNNSVDISSIFYTQKFKNKNPDLINSIISKSKESFVINEEIAKFISDTDGPQGILCICEKPSTKNTNENFKNIDKIVLFENIQNPSNIGSIFRSCDALGVKAVAISTGSCDIYSPKVLRGSMGSIFRLNIIEPESMLKFAKSLKNSGFKIYGTVPNNNALRLGDILFENKCAIAFGNEGNGLTEEILGVCDYKLTIPMNEFAESLNVSVAAGISIWEMMGRGKF